MRLKVISFLMLGVFIIGAYGEEIEPVEHLDMEAFSGKWYEIARLPNRHQRGFEDVTCTFTPEGRGRYSLVTEGYNATRRRRKTRLSGRVTIPDDSQMGAMQLRVFRFFTVDYNVIKVDTVNYTYALVSGDSKKYMWILSREPVMDKETFDSLVNTAQTLGFETDRLEMVPQVSNASIAGR
ncbi:lipocalin family protein [Chitinispirillales bacterium ANBcel5]|uniref:lipocalin family protein n=1 Tax=Cellulosispirillum alkaliphilum TaxID=3039283 RepID=UPI002A521010|nr:lipocalin family protein [Chitinispirillales bacterium ANBcel5]